MDVDRILSSIVDPGQWEAYASWFASLEARAASLTADVPGEALIAVRGDDLALPVDPVGRFGVDRFRRFLGAVLAADWLTYAAPDDRANILRLGFVIDRFPQGFRVWFLATNAGWLPVGYSGWYPIDAATYRRLVTNDPPISDRAFVPLTSADSDGYIYIFNYSILPPFRDGVGSRRLLRRLNEEMCAVAPRGMAAITVSPEGAAVAARFGLTFRHTIKVGESFEDIWTGPDNGTG